MIPPMKKCASLLLAFVLCFSLGGVIHAKGHTPVSAADTHVPQWDNTTSVEISLSFDGSKAICGACVIGKPGTTEITGQAVLARRNSNGTYTTVKTWSGLKTTGNILTFDAIYYVSSGYTYRLTISATVYRNGTGETVTGYHEAYAS